MNQPAYIIAEAGVNHDGDLKKAHALIDIAVDAGADAVKFQLFDPESLVTVTAPTASYQATNLADEAISQQAMLNRLVLPENAFVQLSHYCRSRSIDFLCTPFDEPSLDHLVTGTVMRYLKLASGEVTNGPFLLAAARCQLPIILSTGMSNLQEIGIALSLLHLGYFGAAEALPGRLAAPTAEMLAALKDKITLLHCVSQYPAPAASMNLRAMDTMAAAFGLAVGLSDHSTGITLAIAAVARGAMMIEKHFTYDTQAAGPDHAASLNPHELAAMVSAVREVETGLGAAEKSCVDAEKNTREVARRSIVARRDIIRGNVFSSSNLVCKRPATGPLAPNDWWRLLGKKAAKNYAADDFIDAGEL